MWWHRTITAVASQRQVTGPKKCILGFNKDLKESSKFKQMPFLAALNTPTSIYSVLKCEFEEDGPKKKRCLIHCERQSQMLPIEDLQTNYLDLNTWLVSLLPLVTDGDKTTNQSCSGGGDFAKRIHVWCT